MLLLPRVFDFRIIQRPSGFGAARRQNSYPIIRQGVPVYPFCAKVWLTLRNFAEVVRPCMNAWSI